jgi:hypothetical protein
MLAIGPRHRTPDLIGGGGLAGSPATPGHEAQRRGRAAGARIGTQRPALASSLRRQTDALAAYREAPVGQALEMPDEITTS